jgi:dynein intermediate chain 2
VATQAKPVYDVYWIQSRNGSECCSVSTDGRLLWWDTRKLGEGPTDEMLLEQGDTTYGGTSLEYRSDAGATKYLVGTEQGQVVLVDRKASKDKGSQKSIKAVFGEKNGRHHGPVYSIQRNPTNQKYFMTVGDWTTKIWTEDLKAPLLTTKYSGSYLTAASWSPTRPGVFFTTKQDGTLDVWDFFYKQNDPVFTTKVGDYGLTSMAVQNYGKLVAVGSEDGTTSVLELSSALCNIQPDEKNSIAAMFERENKREKNLETRLVQRKRDQKERERQAAEDSQVFDPAAEWDAKTQEAIQKAEEAFYAAMKKAEEDEAGAEAASAEAEGAPEG